MIYTDGDIITLTVLLILILYGSASVIIFISGKIKIPKKRKKWSYRIIME